MADIILTVFLIVLFSAVFYYIGRDRLSRDFLKAAYDSYYGHRYMDAEYAEHKILLEVKEIEVTNERATS